MKKLIVTIDNSIKDVDMALRCVLFVIQEGKKSICTINKKEIPHYCWITTWPNGIHVRSIKKKKQNSPDSLFVWQVKEHSK